MVMVVGAPSIYLLKNISIAQKKRKEKMYQGHDMSQGPAAAAASYYCCPATTADLMCSR